MFNIHLNYQLRFDGFTKVWESTKIGEIAEVVGGGTPKTEVEEYWNGEIKWFTPSEIGKTKYIFDSERHITNEGLKNSSAKLLPKNTILLSSRATVGEISIASTECSTNQGFQSLITKNNVDNEFIYYLITTIKNEFLRRSSGSTFLEISKNEIKRIPINIPELSEQNKISNLFSAIDNKIGMLEKKHQYYQDFKKYLMQRIFSSQEDKLRFDYSDEWKICKLKDICNIQDGTHSTPSYVDEGVPFYSVETITNNVPPKFISKDEHEKLIKRCKPQFGDILITRIGTLAKSKIIDWNEEFSIYVSLALLSSIKINSNYLDLYLQTEYFQKEFLKRSLLLAVPQKINLKDLKELKIKYPSFEEQNSIVNLFKPVDSKLFNIESELLIMKNFKEGLLQQMFIYVHTILNFCVKICCIR